MEDNKNVKKNSVNLNAETLGELSAVMMAESTILTDPAPPPSFLSTLWGAGKLIMAYAKKHGKRTDK